MAFYKYSGIAWQGGRVSGTVEAGSDNDAAMRIRETCEIILSMKKTRRQSAEAWDSVDEEGEKSSVFDIQIGTPKLNLKTFSVMCNQFSIILRSGMPVAQTVKMVADTLSDKTLQRWLKKVLRDVESGLPLADSMAARGGSFLPRTFIETVRAGEASGNLDRSFTSMSKHFEKQYKMRAQIRGAMVYPALVLVVAIIVMAVIMVYVVPVFTGIFESAGSQIPPLTQLVIDISTFFRKYWLFLPIAVGGLIFLYGFLDTFPKIHLWLAKARLRLPVLGPISLLSAACQFTSTMSTLMSSGLTIVDATEITANVIGNAYIQERTMDLIGELERGRSLGDAMREQNIMPSMLIEMVSLGERTGELEQTLAFIGDYYDEELDVATSAAVKKLGPTLLVIIGGFSLFLVAGVYSGMFNMYSAMGDSLGLNST